MNRRTRVLLVAGCVLALLAVASALPAADPRIENPTPGGPAPDGSGEDFGGDWDSVTDLASNSNETTPEPASTPTDRDRDVPGREAGLEVSGTVAPGNEVTVGVAGASPFQYDRLSVLVDGERVGDIEPMESTDVRVPFAEDMTISVPEVDLSRTLDVPTTARIAPQSDPIPGRSLQIATEVEGNPISAATVYRNGTAVATTNDSGEAVVDLPASAGPVGLRVERSAVTGTGVIDVPAPTVAVTSPFVFPMLPAPVQVTAGDASVPNATVSVADGGTARADEDGHTMVAMPIDDQATVSVDVGAESATATVSNLYFRLATIVVFVPGFGIGAIWTYLRLVPESSRYRRGGSLSDVFVAIAAGLASLLDALSRPSIPVPRFSVGVPLFDWGNLPRFTILSATLSFPRLDVFGGVRALFSREGSDSAASGLGGLLDGVFDRSDDETSEADETGTTADGTPTSAAEMDLGPRAEIRIAWYDFVDRLDVDDPETAVPGAVARRAVAAGFPAAHVGALLGAFRAVEYGNREPTTERLLTAQAAAERLAEYVPEEVSE